MQTTHNPIANSFSAGMSQQPSIIFPVHYAPGTTDNFVSNETVAKGISAQQIWALLHDISKWESYYKNCAQITVPDEGPQLEKGRVFKFSTFGFPPLTCTVRESVEPGKGSRGSEGRLAWESKTPEGLEIYHAWLVQDLENDRVRILTQESQIGPVSRSLLFEFVDKEFADGYRSSKSGVSRGRIRCC